MHSNEQITIFDHQRVRCNRSNRQLGMPGEAAMPHDASALELILSGDPALLAIVRLSLVVSLLAVAGGALIGLPFGALIALARFPGRELAIVILNALMGLPPVVVGLAVYLLLSRSGPLGSWGLLFTPQAMVIAQ